VKLGILLALFLLLANVLPASAANTRYFPETQQNVRDAFLDFFDANGGLDVFGFPRTGEFTMNGHYVQYFQRARFEYWPENPAGQQVQLGLLAVELGKTRPPSTQSADPNRRWFQESQHSIGGGFREFWESRGGAAVFGYPITDETDENGHAVQYFQRARFEWHGENPPAYRVQLGLLGDEQIALGKVTVPTEAMAVGPSPILPVAPAAAGPGTLLVSTGIEGDFYLMDPTGENAIRIGAGTDPNLSRDGTKIAYATNNSPNQGLYVANRDGTAPALVYAGRDVRGPVFSPDGAKIAFWERYDCIRIVNRKNLDDKCTRVKVIPTAGGADWLIPGQSAYANSPTWSPDGTRVLFKDEKTLSFAFPGTPSQGARVLFPFETRYQTPSWTPAGGQIAVAMDMNKDHYDVGVIPDDGSSSRINLLTQAAPFTHPTPTNLSPAFSPDGTKIAFVSDQDGALHLWTMNADGSRQVKISDLPITSLNSFERLVSWGGTPGQVIPVAAPPPPAPAPAPFVGPNLRTGP
jgi:Tol biopolymer transport system component